MSRENTEPEGTTRNRGRKGVLLAKLRVQCINRGVNR